MIQLTLPIDSNERKGVPMAGGCRDYFPAALAGVARWSKQGNDKHNPGEPLHHARGKSMDHEECIERHSMDLADVLAALDRLPLGVPQEQRDELIRAALDEYDARSWRSLAASQEFREKHGLAPLAPGARLPNPYTGFDVERIPAPPGGVLQPIGHGNTPQVERQYQQWEANAAQARADAAGAAQKPVDATEAVIEKRRVEAMQRRVAAVSEFTVNDRPLEVSDDWSAEDEAGKTYSLGGA